MGWELRFERCFVGGVFFVVLCYIFMFFLECFYFCVLVFCGVYLGCRG